jgi:maltose O-acetyltransferase
MISATERARMVAGELYHAWDPELVRERARARTLLNRYNASEQDSEEERRAILSELLASVGERAWIEPPFSCDYGWNISLGERAYLNFGCVLLDCAPIEIGPLTKLGPGVHLYAATHPTDPDERAAGLEYALPIEIGKNVWIGGGAIIGPGVRIGENSVIGAGSVVVRDIPANVVAAGNPCRVVRTVRFSAGSTASTADPQS